MNEKITRFIKDPKYEAYNFIEKYDDETVQTAITIIVPIITTAIFWICVLFKT